MRVLVTLDRITTTLNRLGQGMEGGLHQATTTRMGAVMAIIEEDIHLMEEGILRTEVVGTDMGGMTDMVVTGAGEGDMGMMSGMRTIRDSRMVVVCGVLGIWRFAYSVVVCRRVKDPRALRRRTGQNGWFLFLLEEIFVLVFSFLSFLVENLFMKKLESFKRREGFWEIGGNQERERFK